MTRYRAGAWLHLVPAVLYVGVIFYFGSVPLDPLAVVHFSFKDKVLHAVAFGGMQLTQARALAFFYPEWSRGQVAFRAAVIATVFGGLLELWQMGLPYRSADPFDFLADAVGAALAACLYWKLDRTQPSSVG